MTKTIQSAPTAARRPGKRPPKKPPKRPPRPTIDLGTPETRAKAVRWFWAGDHDADRLSGAAQEIRLAWLIICAGLFAKAHDLNRVNGIVLSDSDGQHAAVTRYHAWRRKLAPRHSLALIIDCVVDCRDCYEFTAGQLGTIRRSLELYLKMFPSPLDMGRESD